MNDLISRKHFDERVRLAGGMIEEDLSEDFKEGVLTVLEMLKTEPSAQPETEERIPETEQNVTNDELISKKAAIDSVYERIRQIGYENNPLVLSIRQAIRDLPSAQPEPISEEYAKAVRTWLINYQVRCAELEGRYTPYEILGWIVSDWRKENEIW